MSARVRLLPALIGAAGVLMMLRIGAMASSAEQPAAPTHETEAAAPQQTPASETPAETASAATESAHPAPASAPETASASSGEAVAGSSGTTARIIGQAQTKGEAEVLQNLSERRAALEARERDVAMREQLMSATEKRVEERLVELKSLEEKLNAMLAKRDGEEEAQLVALVKTYENMKPTDAARIFNKLDRTIMLSVASRMKPAKIAAVMAAMEPARAQELTVLLATRMRIARAATAPEAPPAPVAPAAPAPVASAAAPTPVDATAPVAPTAQPEAPAPTPPKT